MHVRSRADDGNTGFELWVRDGRSLFDGVDQDRGAPQLKRTTAAGRKAFSPAGGDALTPADIAGGFVGSVWAPTAEPPFDDGTMSLDGGRSAGTEPALTAAPAIAGVPALSTAAVTDGTFTLFFANDGVHSRELWVTDGTAEGTMLLADIWSGQQPSNGYYSEVISPLDNGQALFWANDGTHGRELWVTDGTPGGTTLVKDINPGPNPGAILDPSIVPLGDGRAVFGAFDPTHGGELWVTDGTEAGTVLVKDIFPGRYDSQPYNFEAIGYGKVLFFAYNGDTIYNSSAGLWITDGTEPGTVLLKSFYRGAFNPITAFDNGTALFFADDGVHGYELWVTDGTAAGTTLVKDITPGSYSLFRGGLVPLGDGTALFCANDGVYGSELWVTDGTTAGTMLVKDINSGPESSYSLQFCALGNGTVLFSADDGVHGNELWITDGTPAGTVLLVDINPEGYSVPHSFEALGSGRWLFSADDGAHGEALWVTDGTAAGTVFVKDINPDPYAYSYISYITALGDGTALFSATDGTHGRELWITDGTEAGTFLLDDINESTFGSLPSRFAVLGNGTAVFGADQAYRKSYESHDYGLWLTDGTAAGTAIVQPFRSSVFDLTAIGNGKALFQANDGIHGYELWVTDGTIVGTTPITNIYPDQNDFYPLFSHDFTPLGNGLTVFSVFTRNYRYAGLWVTDGTAAGTVLVQNAASTYFAALGNGKALFRSFDAAHGTELWITDGTTAGTVMVADIQTGRGSSMPRYITALGDGKAIFSAGDSTHGVELWVSDGTTAGTALVKDISPGLYNSQLKDPVALGNGKVLFQANDGVHGQELWITDGTAAGTALVADIQPGSGGAFPNRFTPLGNGTALFSANDGVYGSELWFTDGTTAGTRLVKDINPGFASSSPTGLRSLGNGTALFSANDGVYGSELWFTDGTAAGTALVKDINPGPGSSSPSGLAALGDGTVIFFADDGFHGKELWTTDGSTAGTALVEDVNSTAAGSFPGEFTVIQAPCYCRGTLILTEHGDVAIEDLAIGDRVVTLSGAAKPIKWIGWRAYDGRFIAGKPTILPICIAAGALAENMPARDLWVSPEHSLYLEGALVQARHLLNGATISQPATTNRVEYFHIELEQHDVIFAEGAPAETFVDCDNRLMFQNGAEFVAVHPQDDRPRWEFCLPRLDWESTELSAIREMLLDRAEILGHRLETDPDLRLVIDGTAIRPESVEGFAYSFAIPAGSKSVWLDSRSTVPAEIAAGTRDGRRLGVAIESLVLSNADLVFAAPRRGRGAPRDGFHDDEGTHRWTDGHARIPAAWLRRFAGGMTLEVRLASCELGYRIAGQNDAPANAA